MRYHRTRFAKRKKAAESQSFNLKKQPYEVFLVLDIEGTCKLGGDFEYPNEIIEFPVCMLRWTDRTEDGKASTLELVDEFRTYVRPTWRPTLSDFCTTLTGITQEQVDSAPLFTDVLMGVEKFLVKNGLIDAETGERLVRYCWCSDGPFDIRDFVVKQCFISQVEMPEWVQGDVLDVRSAVLRWMSSQATLATGSATTGTLKGANRRSLNIPAQLKALGLPEFEGRQHSGIDVSGYLPSSRDSRNIAKIVTELARQGVSLFPNTAIQPNRRWRWMGKHGQILEEGLT
ncbi:ribonuclease H-like domain-containing protein [Crassisporium funariophilum]|nr:ribonuclease H-like domain-containing protein [Crassisporium funariophilum]